ncbi:hypothetical protein HUJ05_007136 [Dendroctonus ponderosae]|nr:hypothetical protein HUJ05_007136 [Dendroctonus ponderosae]
MNGFLRLQPSNINDTGRIVDIFTLNVNVQFKRVEKEHLSFFTFCAIGKLEILQTVLNGKFKSLAPANAISRFISKTVKCFCQVEKNGPVISRTTENSPLN